MTSGLIHDPRVVNDMSELLSIPLEEAVTILDKAVIGKETTIDGEQDWFDNRMKPNTVFIDESGYSKMCIDALKTVRSIAGTDYGSSRQRDLVQKWADTTRGYLGEVGFQKLLLEKYKIDAKLDHEQGSLADYLPLDIHQIKKPNEEWRVPNIKVGIKATKWNGIWLDIAGAQFHHSDVHILVKVGAGQDHLVAYMKSLSVFKDKILRKGIELGHLSEAEADIIYDSLPSFRPIPAYICGFVKKDDDYSELSYDGRKINHRNHTSSFEIFSWKGKFSPLTKQQVIDREHITAEITFKQIGKFSHDDMYLFNAGNLKWSQRDWQNLINSM
jgi:hypothetical protein